MTKPSFEAKRKVLFHQDESCKERIPTLKASVAEASLGIPEDKSADTCSSRSEW